MIKRSGWDDKKFQNDKKRFMFDFLAKSGLPQNVLNHVIYSIEATSYLEKYKVLNSQNLKKYAEVEKIITKAEIIEEKLKEHFETDNNDVVDVKLIIRTIYERCHIILEKLRTASKIGDDNSKEIFQDTFLMFFILVDLIEYLQNGDWAKKDHVNGLKFLQGIEFEKKDYAGSQNLIEYDKILLNIYQLIDKDQFEKNLILGYKFK